MGQRNKVLAARPRASGDLPRSEPDSACPVLHELLDVRGHVLRELLDDRPAQHDLPLPDGLPAGVEGLGVILLSRILAPCAYLCHELAILNHIPSVDRHSLPLLRNRSPFSKIVRC